MESYLLMEHWATLIRDFKDSEKAYNIEPYETEQMARHVLQFIRRTRIRQWNLFIQQRGEEFETMLAKLEQFNPEAVRRFLSEEEIWKITLEMGEQ
jgi:DNA-binding TFAR19-related protein (PDSD5 family)